MQVIAVVEAWLADDYTRNQDTAAALVVEIPDYSYNEDLALDNRGLAGCIVDIAVMLVGQDSFEAHNHQMVVETVALVEVNSLDLRQLEEQKPAALAA